MKNGVTKYETSVTDFVLIFCLSIMANFLGHSLRPEVRDDLKTSKVIIVSIAFMAMIISFLWFQNDRQDWDVIVIALVAVVWFVAITRLYTAQIFVVLGALILSLFSSSVRNRTEDSITEHYAQVAQLAFGVIAAALTAYWAMKNGPGQIV